MNLKPVAEELTESILSLQDYLDDSFKALNEEGTPVTPEDFQEILRNHFCDFLDSSTTIEKIIESTVEKTCKKYSEEYNKEHRLANVYNLQEYRNKKSQTSFDALKYMNTKHPSMSKKNKKGEFYDGV